jgi:hypothetical protein
MFNLDQEIKKWKRSLAKYESFEDGTIAELESHLRDNIDDLVGTGTVRKSVKVITKTSSFNAFKGVFTFLRTVPVRPLHYE